ncbi:MAG: hypothetical protein GF393_05685, partial [Armatimonadia bacterium]|nr:hypothetical protein [Armatimonadia bacterium]
MTVEASERVTITIGDRREDVGAGMHTLETEPLAEDALDELAAAIERDAAAPRPDPPSAVPTDLPEIPVAWSSEVAEPGAIASYHVGDVNADGADEVLVGLEDGRALCLDAEG